MPLVESYPLLYFKTINQDALMQYISTNIIWKRQFLTDPNTYKLQIKLTQYTENDLGLVKETKNEKGDIIGISTSIKVIALMYNEGVAYRYAEADLIGYDLNAYWYTFQFDFETNDVINDDNKIKIENVRNLSSGELAFGFFNGNINIDIYILTKFTEGSFGLMGLDAFVPNLAGYTVCNVYNVEDGIDFFSNYTNNISSFVNTTSITSTTNGVTTMNLSGFGITGMPVVKHSYSQNEDLMQNIIDILEIKKAYIDAAIRILENGFNIDMKFFNTHGPSKTYTTSTGALLDKVNLILNFRLKLLNNIDKNTKDNIVVDIKETIEDLSELNSFHIPNLITSITTKYKDSIEYIEFLGINNYGPGMQHLYRSDADTVDTVPEFLCINSEPTTGQPEIHILLE
jgi:hypothetical protein